MTIALAAILAVQAVSAQPEPAMQCDPTGTRCTHTGGAIGYGMVANSPAAPAVVYSGQMQLPKAVPDTPTLGPGKQERVVHWPDDSNRDYRRTFGNGNACLKARAAVLDEHKRRMSAIAVNLGNRGVIMAMELEAPYAVCVPLG